MPRKKGPKFVRADVRVLRIKKKGNIHPTMSICELKTLAKQSNIKLSKKVNGKSRPKNRSELRGELMAAGVYVN